MPSHACPPWVAEPDHKLASIARGLDDFYRFVGRKAKTYPLNVNDIKMWHGKIFGLAVPLAYYAGNFRGVKDGCPCLAQDVQIGGFPGTPYAEVGSAMSEFSSELALLITKTDQYSKSTQNLADRLKAAVHLAAFCEGKIIQIHPFLNGNGRMSRITADYLLARYGFPFPFYPPFARPGQTYEQASAPCMVGNYRILFDYLLTVMVGRVLEVSR